MRKLYLIFAILFVAFISNAQERDYNYVPQKNIIKNNTTSDIVVKGTNAYQINEDFNASSNLPTGWSLQSPDGGTGWTVLAVGTSPVPGWNGGTVTDHTGATTGNVAFCTWSTGGASSNDQYLITPQVAIISGDHLDFWLQRSPDAYADNVDILLSTTGANVSDFTVTLATLTFAANDGLDAWTEYNYDLSAYAGSNVYIAFREHVTDNSADGSSIFVDDVSIGQPEPWDAKLASLTINPYVTLGNVDVTGTIKNLGSNTITTIDLKWSDGTNTYTDNLTGLSIAPNATYNFTHSTQLNVATANQYDIDVWVELASDADNNNDTMSTSVMGLSQVPIKRVMCEEGTGTWCGWCVRGIVGLLYMETNYPNDWIGVAVHGGNTNEPMQVTGYSDVLGGMVSGFPTSFVNRQSDEVDPNNQDLESAYNTEKAKVSPVDVDITNINWNGTTMEVTFDVNATFYTNMTSGDYNINAVIVEDGLTGTGTYWDQHNYYSNNIDLIDVNGQNYKNLPDPIPASQMVYDHVARAILGGWGGNTGDIPAAITDGTTYTHSYTYTVTGNQYKTKLVGFVIDNNTGEILNSIEKNIIPVDVPETNNDVRVTLYPNPSQGQFYMITNEMSTVKVYNSLGQVVYSNDVPSKLEEINISDLANGTYIVKVYSNKQVITKKVVLNK